MSSSQMVSVVSHRSVRLRADVVEEASERLRKLSSSTLRDLADGSYTGVVVVRDGKKHRLRVRVQRNRANSKDVEVTVTLPAGGRSQPELVKRFVKRSRA